MIATIPDARHALPPIVLSRPGPYRNGDVVAATWTLRNFGDAEATGAKIRFELDPGLIVETDLSKIPGCEPANVRNAFHTVDEFRETPPVGVPLLDLAPGAAITITFALRIGSATTAESLRIQAVLTTAESQEYTSPYTPIAMRLEPSLVVGDPTVVTIKANNQQFGLRLNVANQGGLPASGVKIRIPIPLGVDVADPMLPPAGRFSFDRGANALNIELADIAPYSKADIGLQFQANVSLVGDIVQIADVTVTSPSRGTLCLEPVDAKLERAVDFSHSLVTIEPGPYVEAGSMVEVFVHLHNRGRSAAKDVRLAVSLPSALIYSSGSLSINGAPDTRRDDPTAIAIPVVRAHTTTVVRLMAIVKAPAENETRFTVAATIDGSLEIAPYEFAVRSHPDFPSEENYVWIDAPCTIEPQAARTVLVKIRNTGTDLSRQVRIRLDAPEITFTAASILIDGAESPATIIPIRGSNTRASSAVDLGTLGPQEERIVGVAITAPETFLHGAAFPLKCFLRHDGQPEMEIGELTFVGRSFPRISATRSSIKSQRTDNVRIGQARNLSISLKNDGSDVAVDTRVSLDLPKGIRIERASGADLLDDHSILFHDIPAQASSEATVTLRINDISAGDSLIEIHPRVSGERINTIDLAPLALPTNSQSFLDEVLVDATPTEQDAALMVRLRFKNIGDGAANQILVHSDSLTGYASSTTSYNGQLLRDIKGQSPLAYGLALPPVAPGEVVDITFAVNPKSEEAFVPRFHVESEDQEPFECQGTPYRPALKHRFVQGFLDAGATARIHLPGDYLERERAFRENVVEADFRRVETTSDSPVPPPNAASPHPVPSEEPNVFVAPEARIDPDDAEDVAFVESQDVAFIAVPQQPQDESPTAPIDSTPTLSVPYQPTVSPSDDEDEEEVSIVDAKPTAAAHAEDRDTGSAPLRFGSQQRLRGPHALLTLDQPRLERIKSTVDLLFRNDRLGWYRHQFAMRLFAPDQLLGVEPDVDDAWQSIVNSLAQDAMIPLMRLVIPSFEPSLDWAKGFAHENALGAIGTLVQTMPGLVNAEGVYPAPRLERDQLTGRIRIGIFSFFADQPKPSVHQLNAVLPELIPDTSVSWPNLGTALALYRDILGESFKSIVYMADERRHERMLTAPSQDLDDALQHVRLVIENEVA
jgi:hypothetical protein